MLQVPFAEKTSLHPAFMACSCKRSAARLAASCCWTIGQWDLPGENEQLHPKLDFQVWSFDFAFSGHKNQTETYNQWRSLVIRS